MILSASLYMVILYYFIAPFGHEVITVWRLLEIHIYACESRCVYLKTVMVTLLMCDHTLEHTAIFAEATGVRSPLGKCREQTLWIMPAGEPDRDVHWVIGSTMSRAAFPRFASHFSYVSLRLYKICPLYVEVYKVLALTYTDRWAHVKVNTFII